MARRRFDDLTRWSREHLGYDSPSYDVGNVPQLEGVSVFEIAALDIGSDDAAWDAAIGLLCGEVQSLIASWSDGVSAVFVEPQLQTRSRLRSHRKYFSTLGLDGLAHFEQEVVSDGSSFFVAVAVFEPRDWPRVCPVLQRNRPSFLVFGALGDGRSFASEAGVALVARSTSVHASAVRVLDAEAVANFCGAGLAVGRFVFDSRYDSAALAVFAKSDMKRLMETRMQFDEE